MANQIAKNMSMDDKNNLDNMDMNEMISHVTKNVFGMMNQPNNPMAEMFKGMPQGMQGMQDLSQGMPQGMPQGMSQGMTQSMTQSMTQGMQGMDNFNLTEESESDESESNCIFAKTNDICFELNVDLKDFYTGKKKKIKCKT